MIEKENKQNANEMYLYHGTSFDGACGIINNGYDNRYW